MNNRERLMEIISDNGLERRDVAEMLMVKQDEVDSWLLSTESKNHTAMPDMAIELLELKMAMSSSPGTSED
ncbi:MAG: hypothetical protein GKR93_14295 [Gammaproteobacteria bacterium]|nr:hypothetical protein [Gammaproteobacteria bacterium]